MLYHATPMHSPDGVYEALVSTAQFASAGASHSITTILLGAAFLADRVEERSNIGLMAVPLAAPAGLVLKLATGVFWPRAGARGAGGGGGGGGGAASAASTP